MKPEQLEQMLAKASRSVRQLNEHLARVCPGKESFAVGAGDCDPVRNKALARPAHRIRQDSKPISNKLEAEYGDYLRHRYQIARILEQAVTLRLANGLRYTPDWVVCRPIGTFCYEVKGRHAWDDSIAKLKMAASVFSMWHWWLVWKEGNTWNEQEVLP